MTRQGVASLLLGCVAAVGVPRHAGAGSGVAWITDPVAAFQKAEEEGRPVLVLFTGDPCGSRAEIGAGEGPAASRTFQTDCELLELDVLSTPEFAAAAARYLPLLFNRAGRTMVGQGPADQDLRRRYEVGTIPTLLLADPWGNEIVRLVGRTPKPKVVQILSAMPEDFAPLRADGEALRKDAKAFTALLGAASFYESARLGPIAELYYERASRTAAASKDGAARRQLVLARGANLLKLGRAKDAVELLSAEAKRERDGPQADAVLFGWALASLASGDLSAARKLSEDLSRRFPDSAYTTRLRERLAAQP